MDRAKRPPAFRSITPVAFSNDSRLTFKRLRSPTPLPTMYLSSGFPSYLGRLSWLFSGR